MQAVKDLKIERVMKGVLNLLVLIVSFVIYFVLLNVKMATEADMVAKRAEFLMCMGMRKKERKALIRKELLRYYYLFPTVIAVVLALFYTAAVIIARQYGKADIFAYIKGMIPLWTVSLMGMGVIVMIRVTMYIRRAEGEDEKDGR